MMTLETMEGGKFGMDSAFEHSEVKHKNICNEIVCQAISESEKEDHKIGVLLCEGDEYSIDQAVYRLVFPDLLIFPVGGCSNVMRMVNQLRTKLAPFEMYAFGIIDRDALSKKDIKRLRDNLGVYTTKLPFIENIICSPEVLKFVSKYRNLDYEDFLRKVQEELVKILWQRLKETLPINIAVEKNEKIEHLFIGAYTRKKEIVKEVCAKNILYSYRDKVITVIVGTHAGIKGKKAYYSMILDMIDSEEYREDLQRVFSMFIPKLEFYDFDDY